MAGWIVFALFAGFGLVMLGVGVREWLLQRSALAAAQEVEATITKSEVFTSHEAGSSRGKVRGDQTTTYRPDVAFEYTFGGTRYTSDQLRPSAIAMGYASHDSAAEVLRPFPVGARITAYVDPAHPERGFLDKSPSAGPLVFVIVGLLVVPIAWFASRLV